METSTVEESSSLFKVPQSLPLENAPTAVCAENENIISTDSVKGNESDSQKKIPKPVKNRVDVPLPYKEPDWSSVPPALFSFEIIKNGTFVETYNITSSYVVFGRLDVCNIVFEHPSVSRYHAIVQYCQGDSTHSKGFYLYDLGSTHGTFLNKKKIIPKIYYKLKVGYVIKFGGSTRLHIFQGPEEDDEEEKTDTPKTEDDICSWGMGEDAEEEDDLSENPFALSTPNEDLYSEDPKKTLKNWFEREGYEVEYDVEEKGFKTFSCRVQLPIDTPTGDFMPVEASVTGKKKEAVIACALEACRTLDRLGLLRQSHQESRQRKKKKWEENDYYDSDEDTFLDRTGSIEKKREMRKRIEKKNVAETYESIDEKLKIVSEEIEEIMRKLSVSKSGAASENTSETDSLEAYMSTLSDNKEAASDKIERRKLRYRLQEAEKEKAHLEKLLNIARPNKLPPIVKYPGMIGKRLKSKLQIPSTKPEKLPSSTKSNDNEDDEEEESDSETMIVESSKDIVPSPAITNKQEKDSEDNNIKLYGLILNDAHKEDKPISQSRDTKHTESITSSKKRVIGCTIPENLESSSKDISSAKRKKKNKETAQNVDVYATGNADYATWVPPSGQTGDGMTHLNAKYGY